MPPVKPIDVDRHNIPQHGCGRVSGPDVLILPVRSFGAEARIYPSRLPCCVQYAIIYMRDTAVSGTQNSAGFKSIIAVG